MVEVVVSNRSISKMLTFGVVPVAEGSITGGCDRMICHVSFTLGTQGSVAIGVGKGIRVEEGVVVSSSSSSSLPRVRPRPTPSAMAMITTKMGTKMRSLRRRDHGRRSIDWWNIVRWRFQDDMQAKDVRTNVVVKMHFGVHDVRHSLAIDVCREKHTFNTLEFGILKYRERRVAGGADPKQKVTAGGAHVVNIGQHMQG
jgi:hypothetical protein